MRYRSRPLWWRPVWPRSRTLRGLVIVGQTIERLIGAGGMGAAYLRAATPPAPT
ncbi:hypothetical protein [Nocardia higoensis]|uniref:hypothetical protein n=1 Tax=Nocardia higoensis TaxID=228599 RepID=UPI0002D41D0C|nr:hypothetical protein [Nocardia higoensis]